MIGRACPECGKFCGRCSRPLPEGTTVNGEVARCIAYFRCPKGHLTFVVGGDPSTRDLVQTVGYGDLR